MKKRQLVVVVDRDEGFDGFAEEVTVTVTPDGVTINA